MKYSIITPVYNRADCIARCIESVLRQHPGIEVEHIIVDDGSTDETNSIIQSYAQKEPIIHHITFPKNRGTNAARNAAIAAMTGDYGIMLDSDDYFVDDALNIIERIRKIYSGYLHYMFAPDDCMEYYNTNDCLKPVRYGEVKILTYKDFLTERISGDFLHVISARILKQYPFKEELRIYEGVFFLRFYREARKMFFCKQVITIRERRRADSVSRTYIKISKQVIQRSVIHNKLKLLWFQDDLKFLDLSILNRIYINLLDDLLRLSDYKDMSLLFIKMKQSGLKCPIFYRVFYRMRIGFLYYFLRKKYLLIKLTCLNIRDRFLRRKFSF